MVNLPDWIEDIRTPILGDSYSWYAKEPVSNKRSLVIHHSASPINQDGYVIAGAHVNGNGWGGIGYHFVIRHDNHAKGAGIEYVGDLETWRAHVDKDNPGRVGICLVGNFLNHPPGEQQLRLARRLIDYFIEPNFVLPYIENYSQVKFHGLIPGQATACPGHAGQWFSQWAAYLEGGNFPDTLYQTSPPPRVQPAPTPEEAPPPTQEPVPIPIKREWEETYRDAPRQSTTKREGFAVDMTQEGDTKLIPKGALIDIAGDFTSDGKEYVRTQWSKDHSRWYGLPYSVFEAEEIEIPIVHEEPEPLVNAPDETPKISWQVALAKLVAKLIAPLLRILGGRK